MKKLIKFTLRLVMVTILLYISFWLWDSYIPCEKQDEYTLYGACVDITKKKAEQGDIRAMYMYAIYEQGNDHDDITYYWLRRAAENGSIAAIEESMNYCRRKIPGFSASEIEGWIKKIVSPYKKYDDAGTATLIDFYRGGNECTRDMKLAGEAVLQYQGNECLPVIRFAEVMFKQNLKWPTEIHQAAVEALKRCNPQGPGMSATPRQRDEMLVKLRDVQPQPATHAANQANGGSIRR